MSRRADDLDEPTAPAGRPLAPSDPLIGATLGEYRVIAELGRGGMGVVYRGEQPVIGRPVAIKVMSPEASVLDPASEQRMLDEARAANAVRHPNIIDIFSFGELPDGRPYMVMELLEGRSLEELLAASGRLSWKQTRRVLEQSLAALEAAHARGVVHRDLKPGNIFVSEGSSGWRVKLIDFGLARRVREADRKLTRPGMVVGTPGFMAPEQVRGEEPITRKADVYALGLVGWTALMGKEPYEGGALIDVLNRHLSSPLPKLEGIGPLPDGAEELLRRMTHKDPAQRPEAMEALVALERLEDEAPAARSRSGVWVGVGVAAVAAVLGVVAALGSSEEPHPPPVIRTEPVRPPIATKPVEPDVEAPPAKPPDPPAEPAAPQVPGFERAWPCTAVVDVTPLLTDVFDGRWRFFSVSFEHERSVVVFADATKKPKLRALTGKRDAVAACRGTSQRLAAKHIDVRHTPFHTDLVTPYGGDVVEVDDVALVPGP